MMEEARRERHRARVASGIIIPISRQRELAAVAAAAAPSAQEDKEDTEDEAVNFLMSMSGELRVTRQVVGVRANPPQKAGTLGVREVPPKTRSKKGKP